MDWEDDLLALAEAPAPPKKKKKSSKKRKRDSSASDMELSEGAGSDLEAASAKDEDSDASGVKDEQDEESRNPAEQFPYEGIYKSAAEKSRLMEMTELDRETILEERRELLQQYTNRQRLAALVSGQDGSDADAKPARRATRSGKASQLDELKRRRQAKNAREEKKARRSDDENDEEDADGDEEGSDEEKTRRRRRAQSVTFSDEEDEDASGDEVVSRKKGKEVEQASRETLQRIVLPRGMLATLWATPFFSELVTGAYVRQGVGLRDGEPEYRLACIDSIAEKKTPKLYQLDRYQTDMMLMLQIGNDKKAFTMEQVSNAPVSEREYDRFIATLTQAKIKPPTTKIVENKLKVVNRYKGYTLTEADFTTMFNKKREASSRGGDLHERHLLLSQRDIALRAGDTAEAARINAELGRVTADPVEAARVPMLGNGSPAGNEKKPTTFKERRKALAANIGLSTPKALAGKVASNQNSRPGSGASTPLRQPSVPDLTASPKKDAGTNGPTSHPANRFQKLLAAKVDIDLGDF